MLFNTLVVCVAMLEAMCQGVTAQQTGVSITPERLIIGISSGVGFSLLLCCGAICYSEYSRSRRSAKEAMSQE